MSIDNKQLLSFLFKQADNNNLLTTLQYQQQRVVDKMNEPARTGLVVAHGLGSGKTLTSIAAINSLNLPADVVVPAALKDNYLKELKKHLKKELDISLHSLQNTALNKGEHLNKQLLVVDEAHRLRNPGKASTALKTHTPSKIMALTASPFYNHPADIASPINLVAGENILPENVKDFEEKYITSVRIPPSFLERLQGIKGYTAQTIKESNKEKLRKILNKYVDYYPGSAEGFPTRTDETIKVEMSPDQVETYDKVMKDIPPELLYKIRQNMPANARETANLNAFLTAARQVSNTTAKYTSAIEQPKIDTAVSYLMDHLKENNKNKAIVYSNFLDSGINPYKQMLDKNKIPYGEFTGEMPHAVRDQLIRDYNKDKIKALLLSSAGGEGLDLKGTSLIQILEPHWNDEKIKQVIGRGIRYKSHEHLSPEERKIKIQKFISTLPRSGLLQKLRLKDPDTSTDEYLQEMSDRKERLLNQFRELLSEKIS